MSAIFGITRMNDERAMIETLDRMAAGLSHRGPDGLSSWHEGPVGLGHGLLATTSEPEGWIQPFHHRGAGLAITADARLDNRAELARRLDISHSLAEPASTVALL